MPENVLQMNDLIYNIWANVWCVAISITSNANILDYKKTNQLKGY